MAGGYQIDPALAEWLGSVSRDPYAFVMGAFPWGVEGTTLEFDEGPEPWQRRLLCDIRDGLKTPNQAIREATASGHGIGKSCCVSWIVLWAISTMPDTRGVVTANTETQLKTKTWSELGKWYHLFIAKDMFKLTATALFQPERERTWRVDMIPRSERNTEAFAGMHNKGRRILIIFDEASAIIDTIWETAEGALTDTDTEIIWAVFGNPTRNVGRFKECFPGGKFSNLWHSHKVDSREVSFTNKADIASKIAAYGEDSDYIRIRVKGEFPRKGLMEFFNAADIKAAMTREVHVDLNEPLALGVDVARYGMNNSVIFPRKGRDARTIAREVFNGLNTVDLAQRVFETSTRLHADGLFIDGGGVGGGVVDNTRRLHLHCYEVQFGGRDIQPSVVWGNEGERYANNRSAMYGAARAWLKTGAIPNDPELEQQLLSIRYYHNPKDEIILEPKEDLIDEKGQGISVDDADALVLTFAYPLSKHANAGGDHPHKPLVESEYNPFDQAHMEAA